MREPATATVAQLSEFDEIIDVRSEGEFAEDHIPGAVNCPALDDRERARVGTIYKRVSAFEAKKLGAALVSANIARHLRERFLDRPREWRPLFYCWRGGNRSAAFARVFFEVGWRVARLEGGYQAYRRAVVAALAELPGRLRWRVICGLTGTGKSRLLRALAERGTQVLDLEALAEHRGSVLGQLPGAPQPTQKMFESRLWSVLTRFDPARPVFVEAESRRVGDLLLPEALVQAMWAGECVLLEAPLPVRTALLKEEYAHFLAAPETLLARLQSLAALHGHAALARWRALAGAARWEELIEELLQTHYDPAYTRAIARHYARLPHALRLELEDAGEAAFAALAERCISAEAPPAAAPAQARGRTPASAATHG